VVGRAALVCAARRGFPGPIPSMTLGYKSWRHCVVAEFDQSKTNLYRQLEAAKVDREISLKGKTSGNCNEASNHDTKRRLPFYQALELANRRSQAHAGRQEQDRLLMADLRFASTLIGLGISLTAARESDVKRPVARPFSGSGCRQARGTVSWKVPGALVALTSKAPGRLSLNSPDRERQQ
jgi:hypothetical protein